MVKVDSWQFFQLSSGYFKGLLQIDGMLRAPVCNPQLLTDGVQGGSYLKPFYKLSSISGPKLCNNLVRTGLTGHLVFLINVVALVY